MRTRLGFGGILATLAFGASVFVSAAAARADDTNWTQFRLNARNNPVVSSKLKAAWRIETGAPFSASPSVVGTTLFIGNNGGTLYAVDVRTGTVLWKTTEPASLMSNPLIWNGSVIVGEGNQGAYTGDSDHPVIVGPGENALIAYDAVSGAERWRVPLRGSGMPTAAIVSGVLVHHDGFGDFLALDPDTGRITYRKDLKSIASMSAILPVGDGRIVTNGVGATELQELNAGTGDAIWTHAFDASASGIGDCPAATNGTAIVCDYVAAPHGEALHVGDDAIEHAYALDAKTGALLWDVALEDGELPQGNESAIPLLEKHFAFVGSAVAPVMHALDAQTGRTAWSLVVRGAVKDGPVLKDGIVYFGDLGGYLWAVDVKTGNVVGDKSIGVAFNVGSPVIVGETLIIGSETGALLALPLESIRSAHDP